MRRTKTAGNGPSEREVALRAARAVPDTWPGREAAAERTYRASVETQLVANATGISGANGLSVCRLLGKVAENPRRDPGPTSYHSTKETQGKRQVNIKKYTQLSAIKVCLAPRNRAG
jgi:hypothetical protein